MKIIDSSLPSSNMESAIGKPSVNQWEPEITVRTDPSFEQTRSFILTFCIVQCRQRWYTTKKPGIHKGKWTPDEDHTLLQALDKYGHKWSLIANCLPGRTPPQCRERWHFFLSPDLDKSKFTSAEDELLCRLHEKHGNKWSLIAREMETKRSEASLRMRYKSLTRKQIKTVANIRYNQDNVTCNKQYFVNCSLVCETLDTKNRDCDTHTNVVPLNVNVVPYADTNLYSWIPPCGMYSYITPSYIMVPNWIDPHAQHQQSSSSGV